MTNLSQTEAVARIRELMKDFFECENDQVDAWLQRPNLDLGGSSPQALIDAGRANKVLMVVEALCNGY